MSEDPRYVYGAMCSWHGPISETARAESGLPVCPKCGGVLFEMASKREWDKSVEEYARSREEPVCPAFVEYLRTAPCIRSHRVALAFTMFKESYPSDGR